MKKALSRLKHKNGPNLLKKVLPFIQPLLLCCALQGFAQSQTFQNPLLPSGPDPYSTYYKGYYYYMHSMQNRLVVWKTKNLADLTHAEQRTVWTPPPNKAYSKELWAPEILRVNGHWYIYFAADDGNNAKHRMYVLENKNDDPFTGEWDFKGKIAAKTDKWAIDGDVFEYKKQWYMVWSGWEGDENGQQNIYIAKMKNATEIDGERVLLAEPTFQWETYGDLGAQSQPPHVNVNEGPQFLYHDGHLFLVFSASGCWTDHYSLGFLEFKGQDDDLLRAENWYKHPEPLLTQSPENGVYGTGHNSFFKSPISGEDWILYHANSNPAEGCGPKRSPRMQRVFWNADGTPFIGKPVSENTILSLPN
ncbi:glycoside hydrolase family 43 protein [Marinilongibacter aquaticus]|uniref:glycoside hydrolase family 43 protein n=1 Tax=Marinilongibacter aquaticus TaxID=2975157 RepID=UPI0021BDCA84|nr:glycoside hydrolase family 43 protein [Marinilongibacter aquaticus]UBM59064.1 glycoside hydrolase family 43 protein [Marinilongibacter aquaticus]